MQALYFQEDISEEQYQMAVRVLEAMNIKVKPKKPQMTEEKREQAFYDMIDEALKSPARPLTDELYKELFNVSN